MSTYQQQHIHNRKIIVTFLKCFILQLRLELLCYWTIFCWAFFFKFIGQCSDRVYILCRSNFCLIVVGNVRENSFEGSVIRTEEGTPSMEPLQRKWG